MDLFTAQSLLAQGQGRGDNPSDLGGILVIVGIVVAAVVLALLGHALIHRFGRSKPKTHERDTDRPPIGRVSKDRGP